jgi:hypothetical protein
MTTLTLHHGANEREFVEHPMEVARRALIAAAEGEPECVAAALRRVAGSLPERPRTIRKGT